MTICTYNARTLASEAVIEDLMMQTKKTKYVVFGLTETRRRHLLNGVYETGEELFLETCDSRGVSGVGVLFKTSMAKNIDFFEQLTTRIERLRMRRCGPTPTIFVAYAPTSSYEEEEAEGFYMDLEKFYREDHAFYKVKPAFGKVPQRTTSTRNMTGSLNTFTTPRKKTERFKTNKRRLSLETLELIPQSGAARAAGNQELTSELARLCREAIKEDLKERRAEVLAEAAEAGKSIRYARQVIVVAGQR
ncbi:hypothetical protein RB195_022655 [Necator americanus]|uniref:Uncharacterized protein n=1 Tax=Necator americanus TaxID=51031 RepID=A0ABR1EGA0_NECAM